jgi:putative aldouronate transport system substrate-binding protein
MVRARDHRFKDANGNDTIVATTFHNGWDYGRYAEDYTLPKLTSYIDNGNGTITADALTQRWLDRNMFIWRMVKENLLDKECFKTDDTLADMKVGNGTALFFAAQYGPGINATKQTGLYTARPEMRYVPVGPLNYADGSPLTQIESQGRTGSPVIFFPKTCRNIEAAFRYIDFLNTKEGKTLALYGIEGQTFTRNAQGQPRLVPDLLNRKRSGDATWEDALREVGGIGYTSNRLWYASLDKEWFGEIGIGTADAAVQEQEDYKKLRPAVQYPGYAVAAYEGEFPEFSRVREVFIDGEKEKTYRERAYFAATEAEARQILQSWQEYLRTQENGLYLKFLDFLAQKAKTRRDIAF